MRYSIRDLLLLTLQLAFVLGLYRLVSDRVSSERAIQEWISGAIFAAIFFWLMWLFSPRKPRQTLTKILARLPNEQYEWQSVLSCSMFLVVATILAYATQGMYDPGVFLMFSVMIVWHWLFGRAIEINEHGVEVINCFRSWSDPSIRLTASEGSEVLTIGNGFWGYFASRVTLTPELAAQVKALIVAHRGA